MSLGETPGATGAIGPAGRDLLRRSAVLTAAAARVRSQADTDAIHDLRVAARRLVAALRVWGPERGGNGWRAARAARRQARQIRRSAGEARELEVHVELLESRVLPQAGSSRSAILPVLASLRERRDRARAAVSELAGVKRFERLADQVAVVVVALAAAGESERAAALRVERRRERAVVVLRDAAESKQDVPLHAARIALKKWRYEEESRGALPKRASKAAFAGLREAQQRLGAVHDHAVLRELLEALSRTAADAGESSRASALAAAARRVERSRLALAQELPKRLRALAGPGPR